MSLILTLAQSPSTISHNTTNYGKFDALLTSQQTREHIYSVAG